MTALVFVWSFCIEPRLIIIRNVSIEVPNWHNEHKGLKVAVLTDFHLGFGGMNRERLGKIIDLTNLQNPDLILLLGDYVNVSYKNESKLSYLADFEKFKSKYGVFGVMGNHESWQSLNKIRNFLKKANVKILENDVQKLRINKKSFWIAGIEDMLTGYPDLNYVMRQINDENPVLLLSHNPDIFETASDKINLILAGHTHGGQIYLPFLVKKINPSRLGDRFLRGYLVKNNKHIFISSGLGTTIIPARFLVPPEIVILTLK